jgi:hypothetical protein
MGSRDVLVLAAAPAGRAAPTANDGVGYRHDQGDASLAQLAHAALASATDALGMALLVLDSPLDESPAGKRRRAVQARGFLVEAVLALSRARIYVPTTRTLAVAVIMASEPSPDAEIARLHQIATRLQWQNHRVLPHRPAARPLRPEDEAQLDAITRGLLRHARLGRLADHKGVLASVGAAGIGAVMGAPLAAVAAAAVGLALLARRSWTRPADEP